MKQRKKSAPLKYKLPVRNFFILAGGICALLIVGISQNYLPNPFRQQSQPSASAPIPGQVNSFLNNQDFEKLEQAGFTIYRGNLPPRIEGGYLLSTLTVVQTSGVSKYHKIGTELTPYGFQFSNQTTGGSIDFDYRAIGSTGAARNAFISGSGNCFTVFVDVVGNTNTCRYKSPSIFSACKTDRGLTNAEFAFYMKEQDNSSGCSNVEPEGHIAIYEERDGIAEKRQ